MPSTPQALRTARVAQPLVSLALLAAIATSGSLVVALVRSEAVGVWMDAQWVRMNDTANLYARQYLDTEDRVVLQDIPGLDNSLGGVFFFGSSNMKWGTRIPDLPSDQRRLIHNFAVGEGSPQFQRQTIEYLVKHKNLLSASPEKTLVVYGTGFLNTPSAIDTPLTVYPNLWRRYGLYEYDLAKGISPAPLHSQAKWYYFEKARCSSFVKACLDRGSRSLVPKSLRRRSASKDPAEYARAYERRMGPDWQSNMVRHVEELAGMADYVRGERMQMAVVLLPLASWHRPLPYPAQYRELVESFCKSRSIPFYDLSALLDDDEFGDHIHANERGLDRLHAAMMEIALAHLRRTGALP